jgi:phosphoribosyl-dephospho-CoA transferase
MSISEKGISALIEVLKSNHPQQTMLAHIVDKVADSVIIVTLSIYGIPVHKSEVADIIHQAAIDYLNEKPDPVNGPVFIRNITQIMIKAGEKYGNEHTAFK